MKMTPGLLVPVLLLLAGPVPASAQQRLGVDFGDRVRLTLADSTAAPLIGWVVESRVGSLRVRTPGNPNGIWLDEDELRTIEVRTGSERRVRNAFIGAVAGGAAGLALTFLLRSLGDCSGVECDDDASAAYLMGGVAGAGVGAVVAFTAVGTRWKVVWP